MKKFLSLILFASLLLRLHSQNFEVEGKMKITDVELNNSADSVIVILPDGTLARRDFTTFNDSGWSTNGDTTDTSKYIGIGTSCPSAFGPNRVLEMVSDDAAFGSIIQLSNKDRTNYVRIFSGRTTDPHPFLWWKEGGDFRFVTDENGYSEKFRINSNGLITVQNRITNLTDPVNEQDAVTKAYVDNLLIAFGISTGRAGIQGLLDAGYGPSEIIASGADTIDFIGLNHAGGIIFYIQGDGTGLVAAPSDQSFGAEWGCNGTPITGADGTAIGTGNQNTIDIDNDCSTPDIAADICANLSFNGEDDWHLPSLDELNEMYTKIGQGATAPNTNIGNFSSTAYWSSSEFDDNNAWYQNFNLGDQFNVNKNFNFRVRAIRAF